MNEGVLVLLLLWDLNTVGYTPRGTESILCIVSQLMCSRIIEELRLFAATSGLDI